MMLGRFSGSLILAVAVTFGLFFVMQALIATGRNAIVDDVQNVDINFTRQNRDEQPETKEQDLPEKPQVQQEPDVPEMEQAEVDPSAVTVNTNVNFQGGLDSDLDLGAPADGDVLPLVRVPPQYPRNALSRGIEGWVVLEFDVTKEGTVTNVRVVEAEPSGIFDRAATRAVEKFKYKPRIVNGQPAMRRGVQFQMTFELNE